jgi:hypothetical protein
MMMKECIEQSKELVEHKSMNLINPKLSDKMKPGIGQHFGEK